MQESIEQILYYHEVTKHHSNRSAKSQGYMDWDNQPNPFRTYTGCPLFSLPFLKQDPTAPHSGLFLREEGLPRPFTLENIGGMIELSLGLSAWKAISTDRWSLRMNPSSGNLHPTESYWILPELGSLPHGTYHYDPFPHALELRAELSGSAREPFETYFDSGGFLVALSSIFWRESWKYGERAYRYCNHDVGHALAALGFAANLMGWQVRYIQDISHRTLQQILGFDRTEWIPGEVEEADLLCRVVPNHTQNAQRDFPLKLVAELTQPDFQGKPEALSRERYPWPIIEETAEVCRKPDTTPQAIECPEFPSLHLPESTFSASEIIRKRRSAVDFDRDNSMISRAHFIGCLQACLPRKNCAPFDIELMEPSVHLFIFVHRVTEMEPGLYVLVRNPDHQAHLQAHTHPQFLWEMVDDELPLYLLKPGNWQREAIRVSCRQDIAGDSAFSLGMVARFREVVEAEPYRYKHLFWETGMIGQVLYLQAEAYGLRGTGIGCFFDNPMHEICGFKDNTYQSLYHFTAGYPVEDERLSTLPPYHHLDGVGAL